MNNDKMREKFEAFAAGHASLKQYAFDKYPADGDEYDSIPLQGAWSAWQASRATLVIELPEAHGDSWSGGYQLHESEVIAAIESVGVKVKP